MLATIVMDVFSKDDAKRIADAIEELCSADDNYGFSSAAIYCFWNPTTNQILYIGLSRVIALRFMQHLGLVECDPTCCKSEQIQEYFKSHDKIGITLMLQSTMEQPMNAEDREALLTEFDEDFVKDVEDAVDGTKNIAFAEGMLIGLHDMLGDALPPWNKMHGSKEGRKSLGRGSLSRRLHAIQQMVAGQDLDEIEKKIEEEGPAYEHLDYLTGEMITPLHAHCSLREMASDPYIEGHEEFLHGARMLVVQKLTTLEKAFEIQKKMNPWAADRIRLIEKEGYLDRKPKFG